MQINVVSNDDIMADHNVVGMTQINSFPDYGRGGDLQAVFPRKPVEGHSGLFLCDLLLFDTGMPSGHCGGTINPVGQFCGLSFLSFENGLKEEIVHFLPPAKSAVLESRKIIHPV